MVFAEIILPLAVQSNYTYRLTETQIPEAAPGKRVYVQFGKNKIYTGIIKSIRESHSENTERMKFVEEILDEHPIIFEAQFRMMEWMAFYYMCTEGEVLKAALPIGLKPKSDFYVCLREEDMKWEEYVTDDKEYLLFEALQSNPELNVTEIADIWNIQSPMAKLKKIEEKGWIKINQKIESSYQAKTKTYLFLPEIYQKNEHLLEEPLNALSRAPQQENLLLYVISAHLQGQLCPKSETLKHLNISAGVVSSLVEKGYIIEKSVEVDRVPDLPVAVNEKFLVMNPAQENVYQDIKKSFTLNPSTPVLLNGITGSGKTLIYVHLIRDAIKSGKQVLYLLPEISITQQIIDRVKRELGNRVGVYHSRFSNNERVEIWQKICGNQYDVVIGVRSAIFLPFENLGLIIIDEEHDRSFKQDEPAPRYNARDVAIWMGNQQQIPVLLGSATPSFETFMNALKSKYHYTELKERAIPTAKLPVIEVVDMREAVKAKKVKGVFSETLIENMTATLQRGEQVILFQNRRGYSPYLICTSCGHVPECINCDISLTYHKQKDFARCHYCGHTEYLNDKCPGCGNFTLKKQGIGTEKIEEEVKALFPTLNIERMDLDTTRGKTRFQRLISRLEAREIDVLVGTQMVSKGLDFENVTLVGVVSADNLLTYPDFRVHEYAYQMLTQVSGRAGRSTKQGKVIIQSFQPSNQVLTLLQSDYSLFYEATVYHRQELLYPPFTRLIEIEIHHPLQSFIETEALRLNTFLKPIFGDMLLGPDYATVPRVRNTYRMQFLLKLHKTFSLTKVRHFILQSIDQYYQSAPNKTLRVLINVDPA